MRLCVTQVPRLIRTSAQSQVSCSFQPYLGLQSQYVDQSTCTAALCPHSLRYRSLTVTGGRLNHVIQKHLLALTAWHADDSRKFIPSKQLVLHTKFSVCGSKSCSHSFYCHSLHFITRDKVSCKAVRTEHHLRIGILGV